MSAEETQQIGLRDLVAGDWVWMPLVVWKHETTRSGGRTYLTPGSADPPPPDKRIWPEYSVATWAHWPEARTLVVGERIEVEMEYTPTQRGDATLHCFYRRDFDLEVELSDDGVTSKMPRLRLSLPLPRKDREAP